MTATIRLCRVEDLVEGEPQQIDPEGTDLSLAIYTAGGGYYVTDALCTHGMALLSDGYQEDFIIECPLHGGSFDIRSGAPLTAPCELSLRTYPVILEEGWVAISRPSEEGRP